MKFTTTVNEDNQIILKLGLNHEAKFDEDATFDDVVLGVETLINEVVGVSAFELIKAVIDKVEEVHGDQNQSEVE